MVNRGKHIAKTFTLWGIVLILGTPFSRPGYANSILVRADDSQEILSSSDSSKQNTNEIFSFLNQNSIHSIAKYSQWLQKNMRYQAGKFEGPWESWQATINRRYGDCKNLSALNAKVVEYFGYKPVVVGYKEGDGGHMFTAFFKDGRINVFDNTEYHVTALSNINDLGIYLIQKHNIDSIFEVNLATHTTTLLVARTLAMAPR